MLSEKELIIVVDEESLQDLIPVNDPTIRLVHITNDQTIGSRRNAANAEAFGDGSGYYANWDDDDIYFPTRLLHQLKILQTENVSVTGFRSCKFVNLSTNEHYLYTGSTNKYVIGSSLMYKKSYWQDHKFPLINISEDVEFAMLAANNKELYADESSEHMLATTHPGNTSPRMLGGKEWRKLTR
jgi:hypothetical protein